GARAWRAGRGRGRRRRHRRGHGGGGRGRGGGGPGGGAPRAAPRPRGGGPAVAPAAPGGGEGPPQKRGTPNDEQHEADQNGATSARFHVGSMLRPRPRARHGRARARGSGRRPGTTHCRWRGELTPLVGGERRVRRLTESLAIGADEPAGKH